tara:strand:+ start:27903 stop:28637 length:735 start_codon:yes stop_codon:yes gene_type:complete
MTVMRNLLLALLLTMATSLSCTGFLVKSFMRSSPIPNWVYIHENPGAGDYAIHETAQGARVRYLVHSVTESRVEVSQRFISTGILLGSSLDELEYRLFLDREGNVIEGYLYEDDGDQTRLSIAGPGDNGYVQDVKSVRVEASDLMRVEAGYFQITELRVHRLQGLGSWGPEEITIIHYGNPEVPFGIVEIVGYQASQLSYSQFANFVKDSGTRLALDVVLRFLDSKYNKIQAELVERGNDTSLL